MTDPITTPAQMREAAARLIDDRCADILGKQDGKTPEVDQNLRLMAVFLPDLAAAIRALPVAEPEPQAVRVKPLQWEAVGTALWARDIYGDHYEIEQCDGAVVLDHPRLYGDYAIASIEEAKTAAEADHAARIRSQIDAVPAAQVRAEALEEAAALPPYDGDGDPAGSFDHHVFVKLDAIRALIEKETNE